MTTLLRPVTIRTGILLWGAALFMVVTGNATFYAEVTGVYQVTEYWPFLTSLTVGLAAVIAACMALFSLLAPVRLIIAVFLLLAAAVGYFSDTLHLVIDDEMIRNILLTDPREARDVVTAGLAVRIVLLGILPVAALLLIRVRPQGLFRRQTGLAGTALSALLVVAAVIVPFSGTYASFFREHKPLRYYTNPTYPIYSAIKLATDAASAGTGQQFRQRVEAAAVPEDDASRELVIVVIGETARADHFGINGYARQTTPKLAARSDIVSFSKMTSCGTSTAFSVPCMFSLDGRDSFSISDAPYIENVIDVLSRAGVSVLWRDNNSGSQGVADRVTFQRFNEADQNPVCDGGECRDIGMLTGLANYIEQQEGDILIVLHQMGSHGPA